MKKKTKLGLGLAAVGVAALLLTGCTASFCSSTDLAHMLAAYDNGVTKYISTTEYEALPETDKSSYYLLELDHVSDIYFTYGLVYNNGGIAKTNEAAKNNKVAYSVSNCEYWCAFDLYSLEQEIAFTGRTINTPEQIADLNKDYGYLRFTKTAEKDETWANWDVYDLKVRDNMKLYSEQGKYGFSFDISKVPTKDYIQTYKNTLNSAVGGFRGCITTTDNKFGNYGWEDKVQVQIEAKDYGYGWSRGFFEGLLVFPIAALIDVTCNAFSGLGNGLNGTNGWAQLLTIFIVTLIVRLFIFAISFRSTLANAKMTNLQPQIAKIQNKYPNANTNRAEKARMAEEMNKLYKKNHINPFSSLIVMIFQFPIFICVWGAFVGSSWLSTGGFLGMNFSDSISGIIFNGSNWANGSAITALITFLLMAGAQVVSMLLPQWLQKRKAKKIAKLGKNPYQNSQNKTMKIVTYVMMAMIIFMGFTLASGMGIYWFVGALISIGQTFATQAIINHQSKKGE